MQFKNVWLFIILVLQFNSALVSALQPLKAEEPRYVTLSGIIIDLSATHSLKALLPILSSVEGKLTLASELQP